MNMVGAIEVTPDPRRPPERPARTAGLDRPLVLVELELA
jgi:hypothetical protein